MAAVTKLMVVLCLLVVSTAGCASETEKKNDEVVQLVYEKMNHAILQAETKIGACLDKEQKTILPSQVFPKLPLSNDEWKSAITYLSFKALDQCQENILASALMAFSRFKVIEKKLTGKNTKDTNQYKLEDLCCGALETEIRAEINYKKIDPKVRQTLESIPELNQPFNPIAALKGLGL